MALVDLLVWLAVIVIVILVAWYILSQLPLPPPIKQIVTIALVVIIASIVIYILLNFTHTASLPKVGMLLLGGSHG